MGFTKEQHLVLLLLGLTVFSIVLFRPFHPFWSPSPASTNLTAGPSPQWIVEVTGNVTNRGIYIFDARPTAIEAVQKAAGPVNQVFAWSGQVHSLPKTGTRIEVGASERQHNRLTISPMEPAKKFVLGIPIPLNQADAEALAMIPGISERLAHRVINFRQARGPFTTWNDLKRVRGIGPKRIEKLQSCVSLNRDQE